MDYSLFCECEEEFIEDYEAIAGRVISAVLKRFVPPRNVQISLYIVSEEYIKELNQSLRGIDKATDVLSFPNLFFEPERPADYSLSDMEAAGSIDPDSGELVLGEIVVCAARVYAQATEYGHSNEREFAFLLAHSMLHLLGYDHEEEEQEKIMFALQEEILKEAGYER